ncbi:MAG: hypothetical protein ACRC39_01650 [Enterobacter sp.]
MSSKQPIKNITTTIKDVILEISEGKDYEWIISQVIEDLSNENWTEKDYIEKVLKPKKIGWNHSMFENLLKKQREQDDYVFKPFEAEEGVVQCFKCKSFKVFSIAVQTRAADEAITTISQCTECNNKWSCN